MTKYTVTKINRAGRPPQERKVGGICPICEKPILLSAGQIHRPEHRKCRKR